MPLFELRNSPILQNKLLRSGDEARAAKRVDATYYYCGRCHFAFSPTFDASSVDYSDYYNKQTESPAFRRAIDELAIRLVADCNLGPQSAIAEIGCGNGYFLSRVKSATGSSHVYGFDPAYRGDYGMEVNVRRRLFEAGDLRTKIDLLVIRHCLEGLLDAEPDKSLLKVTGEVARMYVEFTDLDHILAERNPSLLWHEYYRYFSARSLDIFLRKMGFRLHQVYPLFGGGILGITAIRTPVMTDLRDAYKELDTIVQRHRKVVIWGISGRAISVLSHMSWDESVVAYGVDIDPARHGMYIPVTGQRILSPAELKAFGPDLVIVANENYAAEIREMVGGDARLVTIGGRFV